MSDKYLLREYYELCPGGVCQDLLTEDEKNSSKEWGCFFFLASCSGVMRKMVIKEFIVRIFLREKSRTI